MNAAPCFAGSAPVDFSTDGATGLAGSNLSRYNGSCNSGKSGTVTSLDESFGDVDEWAVVEGANGFCFIAQILVEIFSG